MHVKVKGKFEKIRHVKKNNKSKKYIFRGQRNVRYYERVLSNKKKSYELFLERTTSFSFVRARKFDRATTFTRTFDRDFVRREYNDLKFFRRTFYYAAGKIGMCMNFLLVEWKKMMMNF